MLIRSPADVDELEAAWALACATMTPAFTDTTNLTKLKRYWPDSNTLSKVAVVDHDLALVGAKQLTLSSRSLESRANTNAPESAAPW